MSDGITTQENQIMVPGCSLGVKYLPDDSIAIFDTEFPNGAHFVLTVRGFSDWAARIVDKNRHANGQPYGPNDLARENHATLVATEHVECKPHRASGFWCVWNAGDSTGQRFDLMTQEIDALAAFMGTAEFASFIA